MLGKKAGDVLAERYRLVEPLGKGGMGEVWKAEHLALRSIVAVKVLNADIVESSAARQRFEREARAAANVRSPHVVQILDHGIDGDVPFIVMELLEGETLARRLRRAGRLSPRETLRIATHITRALGKAHEQGVVHRDLKPDNVFLVKNEDEDIAKLLDFGVVKIEAEVHATRSGALVGTPLYMGPEQLRAQPIDARADVWSLAIVTFECLLGQTPFRADSLADLVVEIAHKRIPKASSFGPVPAGFDEWFGRATARKVDERFASAKEQLAALRPILEDAPDLLPSGDQDRPQLAEQSTLAASMGPTTRSTADRPAPRKIPRWAPFVAGACVIAVYGATRLPTSPTPIVVAAKSEEPPRATSMPEAAAPLVTNVQTTSTSTSASVSIAVATPPPPKPRPKTSVAAASASSAPVVDPLDRQ